MINLPNENKKWSQPNNSDLFGNVYATKNINFDDEGYLKLSGRAVSVMNEGLDANVDQASVIAFDQGSYFVQTWDKPFTVSGFPLGDTPPSQITATDAPGGDLRADAIWFNNKLLVSTGSSVNFFTTGGTGWATTNVTLATTSQSQHPMVPFVSKSGWVVANVNTLLLYGDISATPTLVETLTIPSDFMITSLTYFNQQVYIGTRHQQGGKAVMYVWNGSGSAAQSAFEVDSHIIHDITTFQDSVVLLASNGSILRFNGAGFTPLAYFPLFHTPFSLADYQNTNHYKNCLKANEDVLYINFSFNYRENIFLNQPAGVWCYDPKVGLYHKYSPSIANADYEAVQAANINTTTNTFTIAAGAIPTAAICPVLYQASTAVTPLETDKGYWAIRVSSASFKLALTKTDALAGNAIDISGTPSGTHYFVFCPEVDYGQFLANRVMAILPITQLASIFGTDVLWSLEHRSRSNISSSLGYVGTVTEGLDSRGYFVSPKVFSPETNDHFNNLVLKYSPLKDDDTIIVKYRTTDDGLEKTKWTTTQWRITWTSANTFTTTDTNWANALVGDEVEVLYLAGAGLLAHITSITENAGTYTVTIDENFDNYTANDIGVAVFRNWTKFLTLTSADTDGFIERQLDVQGKFIQIKVELRGKGVKIEEIKIDNQYLLPSKK